ncbi:SAM-dependent MidA family methyltransferase [Pseudochelatococcus lubricantis]|uniref:SAM-dependent MidA family methyltransferase n=1 Tax=Pseudochelatococcus lubricantis TaxID=1538102 RepID=A0ABX0V0N4_9HYPH|nr:SAM-dependent methyltransferase [Pseudochelatococcus lubricantis]NIJ58183.1 SAM-dependent MidA family methyltransferase [Pseudochelatococcus lubricantis]
MSTPTHDTPKPETPLAREMKAVIAANGPITVELYMALCLGHPRHGYYMTRDPLGLAGDFVTAPEISQMFGELIGLWAAEAWRHLGEPSRVRLVELGPGRGTLMKDALRAARALQAFHAAIEVHLVETSPVLRGLQAATLEHSGFAPEWHDAFAQVPDGPTIVIANEFFDCLPVRQYVRGREGWFERLVGLDAKGELAFGLAPAPEPALKRDAPEGALMEFPASQIIAMREITERIAHDGGALLVIDYGHLRTGYGETLQAVRDHGYTGVLDAPGEADVTVHVDFAALAQAARMAGGAVHGPTTQGEFLLNLGIRERAAALREGAPDKAVSIDTALARLIDMETRGMGQLFKVMAVAHPAMPLLPGFDRRHDP